MRWALLAVLAVGCASAPKPKVVAAPTVAMTKRAEARPLPPDPADEALPEGLGPDFKPVPVEAGECIPEKPKAPVEGAEPVKGPCPARAGILISEPKVARIKLYQIRYKELRKTYVADRLEWSAHRELYEVKLSMFNTEIVKLNQDLDEALEESWWEENDGTIGVTVGLVAGGILAYLMAKAMAEAVPDTVTVEGM